MELTKEQIIALEPHKFAARFPMADDHEFVLLKDSIRVHGVQIPIVLYNGEILDGRNRHKALVQLYEEGVDNISVNFEEYGGNTAEDYADSLNLVRRHLTSGQKAILAVKFYKEKYEKIKNDAKGRKKGGKEDLTQKKAEGKRNKESAQILAQMVGTNKNYITKAEKIEELENKLNKSRPKNERIKLLDYVFNGDLKLDDAVKLTRYKLDEPDDAKRLETIIKEIDDNIDVIDKNRKLKKIEEPETLDTNVVLFKNIIERNKPPKGPAPKQYPQDAENIGIYFSFPVKQSSLEKITRFIHDELFYKLNEKPKYTVAVATTSEASEKVQTAISDLISNGVKLNCYNEQGNNEEENN